MTTTPTPTTTVELGGREVRIERPTGLKATRALAILRELSKAAPELQSDLAEFRRRYERENVVELDRVQAKLRYPPRPVEEEDPETGARRVVLDEHGAPRMLPSPVDRITEEDWERAGGIFRMPASPSGTEIAMALFDRALELAEDTVYRFLALFAIPNGELKQARRAGHDSDLIRERAEELLDDAYADELLELAAAVADTVDGHFRRKADAIGASRLGGILRLFGLEWAPSPPSSPPSTSSTSTAEQSSTRPSSSTDTPASTDGPPTSSSTPASTSSSSSEASASATPRPASSPNMTPAPEAAAA